MPFTNYAPASVHQHILPEIHGIEEGDSSSLNLPQYPQLPKE